MAFHKTRLIVFKILFIITFLNGYSKESLYIKPLSADFCYLNYSKVWSGAELDPLRDASHQGIVGGQISLKISNGYISFTPNFTCINYIKLGYIFPISAGVDLPDTVLGSDYYLTYSIKNNYLFISAGTNTVGGSFEEPYIVNTLYNYDLCQNGNPNPGQVNYLNVNENYVLHSKYKMPYTKNEVDGNMPLSNDKIEDVKYYTGLGKLLQTINIRAGGQNNDIISQVQYDENGRVKKEYLPYPSPDAEYGKYRSNSINEVTQFYQNRFQSEESWTAINPVNPYTENIFEASPLNRIKQKASPGKDWSIVSDHTIKNDYLSNAINEVRMFEVVFINNNRESTQLMPKGFYPSNQLFKFIVKNENWKSSDGVNNTTEEFKDKEGHLVLSRTYDAGINHDTYYIYDSYGNLSYVIPPKAIDLISVDAIESNIVSLASVNSGSSLKLTASNSIILADGFKALAGSVFSASIVDSNQTALDNLCYQYRYDYRNRLVEKKLPEKQWEFILYDKLDRIAATGPALSPFNDTVAGTVGWIITKYDVLNRIVYTGWEQSAAINSAVRVSKQSTLNLITILNEAKQASGTIDNIPAYYTNTVAPVNFKLLTVNYYDNYSFPSTGTPAIVVPVSVEGQSILAATQVKGLPTASWSRVITSSSSTLGETNAMFYDAKGRMVQIYSQNHLGGYTQTNTKLDFTGKTEYSITYHKRSNGLVLKTKEAFTYSSQERVLTHTHQINDGIVELLASNSYDELGQLVFKKVGDIAASATPLQKIDYTYNIRGWMTGINKTVSLLEAGGIPNDLFAFKINYNKTSSGIGGIDALYNGNISETLWNSVSDASSTTRAYGYQYDNLNRLKSAVYQKKVSTTVTANTYTENLTYDKNSNIITLLRNGISDTVPVQIDNLLYSYKNTNNTNQLSKVVDNAPSSSKINGFTDGSNLDDDYLYDLNGNLIKDKNKNIAEIVYNHLDLPTKITFTSNESIVYIYNALGRKVQKVVSKSSPVVNITTTDYMNGYQYENAVLKYFSTIEGYVEPFGSTYRYIYQYKDHLGNIRLGYTKNAGSGTLEILDESHYYPFGLKHNGYGAPIVSSGYKYKYNGKELQDENIGGSQVNLYDYGARNYDPALGRWMNIDPLAEKSRRFNPYTYVFNNPVFFIDPDGRFGAPPSTHTDEKGNVIAVIDDGDFGVYRHQNNADGNAPTQYMIEKRQQKLGTSAGGEHMGVTLTPFGFADFETYAATGVLKPGAGAMIDFNSTWATDEVSKIFAENPTLPRYAYNARGGKDWDVKNHTPNGNWYFGSNLFGTYASARDAGNFAAGAIAQLSFFPTSFSDYGFGTYNVANNSVIGSIKLIFKDVISLASPTTLGAGAASMSLKANFGENPLSKAGIEAGKEFGKILEKR